MKNNKHITLTFLAAVLGLATFLGTSSFTTPPAMKTDAQFLEEAAHINLAEIEMGRLAQAKSTVAEVRQLGELMEKNHTQALKDVNTLANKKGITLPTSLTAEAKEEYKELNNKSEKHFNDEYCEAMVKGHKHAISLFETIAKESKDSDVREWANATLPTLRMHLEHSKMCKEKCEKM